MQGEHSSQNSFFGMIYEDLIPADHLLCRLVAAVDFSFVSVLVGDCYYCGELAEPQFLYDLSDRDIEEQVNLHLACKSPTGQETPLKLRPSREGGSRFQPP